MATVMDLYSRRIVGWGLGQDMTESLIAKALEMAFARRTAKPGIVMHSDRGVQYRSQHYIDRLRSRGCKISMSRKGNCWDNAPMESFFSRLKVELIYAKKFESIEEARTSIFSYIEIYYNRKRRHSTDIGGSPAEFEEMAAIVA